MTKGHQKIELEAQMREVIGGKVRQLRRSGIIPAVLYGKGQEPLNVQVPEKDFDRALKTAGESTLVYVNVGGQVYPTIIHDVVRHAVRNNIMHADFYKVRLDEKIKTKVPVVFIGESPVVKEGGAIFVRNVNEMEVEALPQDLPHEVTIDISGLAAIGDQVLLKDVKLPAGVIAIGESEEIIATIQAAKSVEELEAELAAPTGDVADVEVIEKEKPAEEVTEDGEAAPAAATEEKKAE